MPNMLQRAFPLLLLSSALAANEPFPRIITTKSNLNGGIEQFRSSCQLHTNKQALERQGRIDVPVGGKLFVRLYGDCLTSSDCIGNQIDNDEYGFPGMRGTSTNFTTAGWFSFAPTLSHSSNSYDICSKTKYKVDDTFSFTCLKVSVKSHRAQFIGSSVPHEACEGNILFYKKVKVDFTLPMTTASLQSAKQHLLTQTLRTNLADNLEVSVCRVSIHALVVADSKAKVTMHVTAKDQAEADGMVQKIAAWTQDCTGNAGNCLNSMLRKIGMIDSEPAFAPTVDNASFDSFLKAPVDGTFFEATVGRQMEIFLPVDSLIAGGCDFTGSTTMDACQQVAIPTGIPGAGQLVTGSLTCPVLEKDSQCECSAPSPTSCKGSCKCMATCPLGPLASVAVIASMSVPQSTTGLPEGATISVAAQPKDCQGNTYTKKVKVAFSLPMTKADFTSAKQTLLSKNFLADTLNVARCKVSIGVIIDATAWNLKKGIIVAMYVTAKDQAEADGMVQAMAVTAKNQTEADRMVQAIATAKDQAEADMIAQALALWTDAGLTSRFIKIGLIGPKDVAAMAAQPTVNDAPLVTSETNGPTNLPSGAAVTPQTGEQPWVFKWSPNDNQRSQAPTKLCFGAFMGEEMILGERRCFSILVAKCRHCVQGGDTLVSIATRHKTDWLHLYYANPSLPGYNPSHIPAGYILRLGVMYDTRWGDDIASLAQRFLVSEQSLLDQNPEILVPTHVTLKPNVAGANSQISLVMRARRRILAGENITVPLTGIEGESWSGFVFSPEACYSPVSTLRVRQFCSPATHAVDDSCGPGLWGRCKYNEAGVMGCLTYTCNGEADGAHPIFAAATWEMSSATLILSVKDYLEKGYVESGEEIKLVVPQSAGLRIQKRGKAPTFVQSLLAVPDKMWDPVAEEYTSTKLCVVLPVCHSGIECLFGSDCHLLQPETHFQN